MSQFTRLKLTQPSPHTRESVRRVQMKNHFPPDIYRSVLIRPIQFVYSYYILLDSVGVSLAMFQVPPGCAGARGDAAGPMKYRSVRHHWGRRGGAGRRAAALGGRSRPHSNKTILRKITRIRELRGFLRIDELFRPLPTLLLCAFQFTTEFYGRFNDLNWGFGFRLDSVFTIPDIIKKHFICLDLDFYLLS